MNDSIDKDLMDRLNALLKGLEYGSIHLVVHDAKVVRIERVERIRLTGSPEAPGNISG